MVAFAGGAWAGTLSSSKFAFAQGDLHALGVSACKISGTTGSLVCKGGTPAQNAAPTDDTGFETIMTTFLRTPNSKEIALDVSLQCGLITFTKANAKGTGGGGGSSKASAEGRITVRVKITPVDNRGDPTGEDPTFAIPDNDGGGALAGPGSSDSDPQGVTYCFRFQELELSFADLLCTENELCDISVSLLLETLTATSFNFIDPNVSPGPKMIEVQARAIADADVFLVDNGELTSAKGEAFIGMGSMAAETVRAVKAFDENTGANPDFCDLVTGTC